MRVSALLLVSLAAAVSRVSSECPDFCPFDFAPVCGSDGVTYPNACELGIVKCKHLPQLKQLYEGECQGNSDHGHDHSTQTPTAAPVKDKCALVCTNDPYPQCGSDGRQYPNACAFTVARCRDSTLRFQSSGTCAPAPE